MSGGIGGAGDPALPRVAMSCYPILSIKGNDIEENGLNTTNKFEQQANAGDAAAADAVTHSGADTGDPAGCGAGGGGNGGGSGRGNVTLVANVPPGQHERDRKNQWRPLAPR